MTRNGLLPSLRLIVAAGTLALLAALTAGCAGTGGFDATYPVGSISDD